MSADFWNDERVSHLRKRWAQGASAAVIGIELHCSRNAAIGKIHRLGLPVRYTHFSVSRSDPHDIFYSSGPKVPRPKREARQRTSIDDVNRLSWAMKMKPLWRAPKQATPPTETPLPPFSNPVTLLDLEPHHCRFPGEGRGAATLFCGAPNTNISPYCQAHTRVCYRAAERERAA